MICVIEGVNRNQHSELIDQMFRMRATVFADRLGWKVSVRDGREIDRFDQEDPVYVLSLDEGNGSLRGGVRLLPTTGPNMLRDVFHELVPDGAVQSPLIWESSRFAVNPHSAASARTSDHNHLLNQTTTELLIGLVDVCQHAGIEYIVSVFDARMARIFRTADCDYELIGTPKRIGRIMAYAGLFEVSNATRRRLLSAAEFNHQSGRTSAELQVELSQGRWKEGRDIPPQNALTEAQAIRKSRGI